MSFTKDLLFGVAEHLDAEGVGVWDLAGYQDSDNGIFIDSLPTKPDTAIALAAYPVDDTGGDGDVTVGLQVRFRSAPGDRLNIKEVIDGCYDALQNLNGAEFGGIPVVRVWQQSGAPLGTDGNNRLEVSRNYYIQLTRDTPHTED